MSVFFLFHVEFGQIFWWCPFQWQIYLVSFHSETAATPETFCPDMESWNLAQLDHGWFFLIDHIFPKEYSFSFNIHYKWSWYVLFIVERCLDYSLIPSLSDVKIDFQLAQAMRTLQKDCLGTQSCFFLLKPKNTTFLISVALEVLDDFSWLH